ncbi:MAG: substrate-binding domain-containing protein [Sulfuriferula sp.]|nr:substrate-binding domain-containing protein [Sulfuriferula sp.]
MRLNKLLAASLVSAFCLSMSANHAIAADTDTPTLATPAATKFEMIPANKDDDLRVFYPGDKVVKGEAALQLMQAGKPGLTIWLAGNQFFAMEDVVHAFQQQHKIVVGVITMPPGKVLDAILKGGWTYNGKDYAISPDVFGMVDMGSVKKLKDAGKGQDYVTYMHNQLVLMVAEGNPKHISGIADLGRPELQVMLPNPVTEGIMKFYAKKSLENNGLWDKLSAGKECQSCYGAPNVYFSSVHHREIPQGIKAGTVDVGIVWATEYKNALKEGLKVGEVTMPEKDSMKNEVNYIAGNISGAAHEKAALAYLKFLGSKAGQAAYTNHGFIEASPDELAVRPVQ